MTKKIISKGKTIEEAVEKALKELGTTSDKTTTRVLEVPSGGFMGIGSKEAKVEVTLVNDLKGVAVDFLSDVFDKMKVDADISVTLDNDTELNIEVNTKDRGILIGRHGQTLDALQYLLSLAVNRNSEEYVRVILDIQGYRDKRKATLEELATRVAKKVIKSKGIYEFEPMNPYERRIIHSYLQDFRNVTTHSVGEGEDRHIIVEYVR